MQLNRTGTACGTPSLHAPAPGLPLPLPYHCCTPPSLCLASELNYADKNERHAKVTRGQVRQQQGLQGVNGEGA